MSTKSLPSEQYQFHEFSIVDEDKTYASSAHVSVDKDSWITIDNGCEESNCLLPLELAELVHASLGRAIEFAKNRSANKSQFFRHPLTGSVILIR